MRQFWKFSIIILAILMMVGCRTRKVVAKEQVQLQEQLVEYEKDTTSVLSVQTSELGKIMEAIHSDSVSISWQTTIYTPPDTAGHQYITRVENGQLNKRSAYALKQENHVRDSIITRQNSRSEQKSEAIVQATKTTKKTDTRPFRLSWWQALISFLGCVMIVREIYIHYRPKQP